MTPAERAAHIRALVDTAPPLRPLQRDRLAALLSASCAAMDMREGGTKEQARPSRGQTSLPSA